MPEPKIRLNLSTLGQLQQPPNPGIGWVGPERPAESWADIAADPLSALFDIGRGAVTGDAPPGMNLQGLGSILGAALPVAQGAKSLRALTKAAAIEDAAQQGIKAYHGSPHDFDQFSLSKIGTGEGAQAYGHGLYFAEREGTARAYRDDLGNLVPSFGGKPTQTAAESMAHDILSRMPGMESEVRQNIHGDKLFYLVDRNSGEWGTHGFATRPEAVAAATGGQSLEKALRMVDEWADAGVFKGKNESTAILDVKRAIADNYDKPRGLSNSGKMYEVQIHASPDQFLDWDKPLSEQSDYVRQALGPDLQREEFVAAAGKRLTDYSGDTLLGIKLQTELRKNGGNIDQALETLAGMGNERWKQTVEKARSLDWSGLRTEAVERPGTGANLISDLQQQHTPAGVNEYLKAKGIPGIRYLDAGSRTAGEGSRNYVIFDENLVSILKKYGVALPVIEGLRERAKQNGGVISRQDVDGLEQ